MRRQEDIVRIINNKSISAHECAFETLLEWIFKKQVSIGVPTANSQVPGATGTLGTLGDI